MLYVWDSANEFKSYTNINAVKLKVTKSLSIVWKKKKLSITIMNP